MPSSSAPPAPIHLVGVPLDLGAARRGVDMGPSALRIAHLADALAALGGAVADLGNVAVPQQEAAHDAGPRAEMDAIVGVCRDLARRVAETITAGARPLVLGGDHSLAAGSVAGAATACAAAGRPLGVVWLDAHADLNTPETSSTGNIHGMPVAHLLGRGDRALAGIADPAPALRPAQLAYVGLRDVDGPEATAIAELGIRAWTMRDIDERGLPAVMRDAIAHAGAGDAALWVSCDADWVDPQEAPGVGTPVPGGATYREAHLAMELLADTGRVIGMDFVEINPVLDRENRSAELAVELIASGFGKRTL